MADQSLLIRIGIDPSGAVTGGKIVEGSLKGLDTQVEGLNLRLGKGTDVGDRFQKSLSRLGGMPRLNIFPMLASDLAYTTIGMTNLASAAPLVRTGLFGVQAGLSALMGPAGLAAVAIAGLAIVTMFKNKASATELARKELDKNLKALNDNRNAMMELYKEGDRLAGQKLAEKLTEAEKKLEEARLKTFRAEIDKGKTIVEADKAAKEATAELELQVKKLKSELGEIRDEEAFNRLSITVYNARDAFLELHARAVPVLDELKTKAKAIEPQFIKAPEGFEEAQVLGEQWVKNKNAIKVYYAEQRRAEEGQKRMAEEAKMWQDVTRTYISSVSSAFVNMMTGVGVRWDQMIQNMIASLASRALESAIMGFLFPGVGFLGFFKGFQSGTPYVSKTGLYLLHQGEAVVPANQNVYQSSVFNQQSIGPTYNVQIIQLDIKKLTKDKIVPILKEMSKNREFPL